MNNYCAIKGCKKKIDKSKHSLPVHIQSKLCTGHISIYINCYKQGNDPYFAVRIFSHEMGGTKRGYVL